MLSRVIRQAELMDGVCARLGIDLAAAARRDLGEAWYVARSRCIACLNDARCRQWLTSPVNSSEQPPAFCANAEFLHRSRAAPD
jgi:hypothetical protein